MEIRRIHEHEGETVGGLWDRMCREIEDGGPLSEQGLRNLSRLLAMSAWHRDAFCLVAVDDDEIIGFVNGCTTAENGLLPGLGGQIDSLYVVPGRRGGGVSRALARAAVAWLREHGAGTIRYLSCAGAHDDHRFWQGLGFEPDMVCLSLYRD
ncbi:GNAT superfamily N-acetyltransferase [Thermocatellispora tengchongensis]|uniref:GNAT superfamily N-acetyltransferase n=1 Tax=Thermocatellispora tengchongensis TaxID=1073253 RepID=A0A840PKS0_9ACTN|nr:GNAT family N-acetyltransferase [Thermocatellispora tengchongensis]MBB5136655.1 GNAT superfamily N-acetyltransferase [Thermocatellispora tengchongensis]